VRFLDTVFARRAIDTEEIRFKKRLWVVCRRAGVSLVRDQTEYIRSQTLSGASQFDIKGGEGIRRSSRRSLAAPTEPLWRIGRGCCGREESELHHHRGEGGGSYHPERRRIAGAAERDDGRDAAEEGAGQTFAEVRKSPAQKGMTARRCGRKPH
jgi:hypothetical protein